MTVFADANFFTNLLLHLPFTDEADRLLMVLEESASQPILVTRLVRQEVLNAFHRLAFESRVGSQGFMVSRSSALAAEAAFDWQVENGRNIRHADPDPDGLNGRFFDLVHRHTTTHGFRTNDVLHVAAALVLGCDTFWSFDAKAKKLAKIAGLRVN